MSNRSVDARGCSTITEENGELSLGMKTKTTSRSNEFRNEHVHVQ